jgi:hypothetical protein
MGFVVKRGDKYSARIVIPKALRPILGQNEFKKSLGTSSKTEAELRAAPLILHWKELIEYTKTDGVIAKAKVLSRVNCVQSSRLAKTPLSGIGDS